MAASSSALAMPWPRDRRATTKQLIDHTFSPSTITQLGTKGVGEAGTIASTPAVVNAIVDAVRHFGVNDIQMPCTPERVWKAIQGAGSGGETEGAAMPHFDEAEPGQDSTEGVGQ